jgi:hypothetical protein
VPTEGERIATLELRVSQLEAVIHSGPGVPWSKSIRGRLHQAEQVDRATENLRAAARELRRAHTRTWSARRRRVMFALGVVSVATPYVLIFLHHG